MKNCPFCAEEIKDAAIVCKHCGRDLPANQTPRLPSPTQVAASGRSRTSRIAKLFVYAILLMGAAALGTAVFSHSGPPPPSELTTEQRRAVENILRAREIWQPNSLRLESNGFVVAEYELSQPSRLVGTPRQLGESALLGIREALLPFGFNDYRVNVNGPSPGTGLVQRFGAARFIEGGRLEWITP